MTAAELLSFIREHRFAVQASVSPTGAAQAAVVGVVVSDAFEVFFDTGDTTRKVTNLRRNPQIALVIGGTIVGDERSVQYEGVADEPSGPELRRLKDLYFESFPDGRLRRGGGTLFFAIAASVFLLVHLPFAWAAITDSGKNPYKDSAPYNPVE